MGLLEVKEVEIYREDIDIESGCLDCYKPNKSKFKKWLAYFYKNFIIVLILLLLEVIPDTLLSRMIRNRIQYKIFDKIENFIAETMMNFYTGLVEQAHKEVKGRGREIKDNYLSVDHEIKAGCQQVNYLLVDHEIKAECHVRYRPNQFNELN